MLPRRSGRLSRASRGPDPVDEAAHIDNQAEASATLRNAAVVRRRIDPTPSKYSTAYGSPATLFPTNRRTANHGTNLAGAFGSLMEDIAETETGHGAGDDEAQQQRLLEKEAQRATREAELQAEDDEIRRRGEQTTRQAAAARRHLEELEQEIDEENFERQAQNGIRRPTTAGTDLDPVDLLNPDRAIPSVEGSPEGRSIKAMINDYFGPNQGMSSRASSAQPTPLAPSAATAAILYGRESMRGIRLFSEPPVSLSPGSRSYIEESGVFSDATLASPATTAVGGICYTTTPRGKTTQQQQQPPPSSSSQKYSIFGVPTGPVKEMWKLDVRDRRPQPVKTKSYFDLLSEEEEAKRAREQEAADLADRQKRQRARAAAQQMAMQRKLESERQAAQGRTAGLTGPGRVNKQQQQPQQNPQNLGFSRPGLQASAGVAAQNPNTGTTQSHNTGLNPAQLGPIQLAGLVPQQTTPRRRTPPARVRNQAQGNGKLPGRVDVSEGNLRSAIQPSTALPNPGPSGPISLFGTQLFSGYAQQPENIAATQSINGKSAGTWSANQPVRFADQLPSTNGANQPPREAVSTSGQSRAGNAPARQSIVQSLFSFIRRGPGNRTSASRNGQAAMQPSNVNRETTGETRPPSLRRRKRVLQATSKFWDLMPSLNFAQYFREPRQWVRIPIGSLMQGFKLIRETSRLLGMFLSAMILLLVFLAAGRTIYSSVSLPGMPDVRVFDTGFHWVGVPDLKQFVPNALLHPLNVLGDTRIQITTLTAGWGDVTGQINTLTTGWRDAKGQIKTLTTGWRDVTDQITLLSKAKQVHDYSLERLQSVIPKIVHLDLDGNGKPVISQEFWHALRNLIEEDELILTLKRPKGGEYEISDIHWYTLKRRLEDSGFGISTGDSPPTLGDGDVAETTSSKSWLNWLKKNQQRVMDLAGGGTGKGGANETVISREDFLRVFQKEFIAHRREIKAEMGDMEAKLQTTIDEIKKTLDTHLGSAGLTTNDVTAIVEQAIRRSLGDAQLAAIANGKITANWNEDLSRQINYFDQGAGAVIHKKYTSPSWQPPARPFMSKEYEREMRLLRDEKSEALRKWEDIGDCWCAATLSRNNGNIPADISVQLGQLVTPQHLVLEHIHAGATPDPLAMPRDIEVWAYIEEYGRRNALVDFMYSMFPDTDRAHPLLGKGFVKVGAFTYSSVTTTGPAAGGAPGSVQVYKLSQELLKLGAATDNVIIRATTNYGADHTCFYRLRLYGEAEDVSPVSASTGSTPSEPGMAGKTWKWVFC